MNKLYGPDYALVAKVHDGDTVTLEMDLGYGLDLTLACRIYGINAPELSTDVGKASRDYAKQLLPIGTEVTVVSHGWDKYGGRFDGSITLPDGRDFGQTMIHDGYAVPMAT